MTNVHIGGSGAAPFRRSVLRAAPLRSDHPPAGWPSGVPGSQLVVELAHDLRSPLTSILMLTDEILAGRAGPTTDKQRRQLDLIYAAALSLCSTAGDVVDFARGGNRLEDEAREPLSLGQVLGDVRDMVLPIAEEKGLALSLATPLGDRRLGHFRALSRVLLNLTTNALKFTDEGSVTMTARSTAGDRIEFAVRDTGPGISSAGLSTLYQPFRSTGTRTSFSGSGLGLTICQRLVTAMGGDLQVKTRTPGGTRFAFELELPPAA